MVLIKRKHATARAYAHDWLEPDEGTDFNALTIAIVSLVIISLMSLALETEASRPDTPMSAWVGPWVAGINTIVV